MKKKPEPPAQDTAPDPAAFERMRELTRRIVNVPKSEIPSKRKTARRKRHP